MTAAEVQAYATGYQRRRNREAWLGGVYTQDAITAVASAILSGKKQKNVYKFPERPHVELQPMTAEEKQRQIEAERLRAYAYFDGIVQACKSRHLERVQSPQEQEEIKAAVYMHQMVEAGKDWGKNQGPIFSEEEMQKKRAQVRGLQAALISHQQGG